MSTPAPSPHAFTPGVTAVDPRGLTVRDIAYLRSDDEGGTDGPLVTDTAHVHRFAQSADMRSRWTWSPRFSARLADRDPVPFSTCHQQALSGSMIRETSADAGTQRRLLAPHGYELARWHADGSSTRTRLDASGRPAAMYERPAGADERCTERCEYAGHSAADAAFNRCGRPTRHDDPSGTQKQHAYGLDGYVIREGRRFLASWDTPDWPDDVAGREAMCSGDENVTSVHVGVDGGIAWMLDAMGHRRRHELDVAGQLVQASLRMRGATADIVLLDGCEYDAGGRRVGQSQGPRIVTEASYDPCTGRCVRASTVRSSDGGPALALAYRYDPVGHVTEVGDPDDAGSAERYAYDSLYRLRTSTGQESAAARPPPDECPVAPVDGSRLVPYSETYRYDADGNLLEYDHRGAYDLIRRMAVSPTSNRSIPDAAADAGDVDAAFDESGRLRELAHDTALAWNVRGQLRAAGGDTYTYDGIGFRVRERLDASSEGIAVQRVRLPGLTCSLDETTGARTYVIDEASARSRTTVHDDAAGAPWTVEQTRFGLTDLLASHLVQLEADGTVVRRERFHAYGATRLREANEPDTASIAEPRYAGNVRDGTGLYDFGYRLYAPAACRWISPDPAGDIEGPNRYAMLRGNPTSFRDALGLGPYVGDLFPSAGLETALREGLGALGASAAGYGAAIAATWAAGSFLGPAALTALGMIAGGLPAFLTGALFFASQARERGHGHIGIKVYALVGGVATGTLGAGRAFLGHVLAPADSINLEAIQQIADTANGYTREALTQILKDLGARVVWTATPPTPLQLSSGAVADAIPAALGALLPGNIAAAGAGIAQKTVTASAQHALGVLSRRAWGPDHVQARPAPQPVALASIGVPSASQVLWGGSTRATANTVGALFSRFSTFVPGPVAAGVVSAVLKKLPDSYRPGIQPKVNQAGDDPHWMLAPRGGLNLDPSTLSAGSVPTGAQPGIELLSVVVSGSRQPTPVPGSAATSPLRTRGLPATMHIVLPSTPLPTRTRSHSV